jgi:Terpene cyclase DEP1
MVSLFVHALLGVAVLAFIVRANSAIFTRFQTGPQVSALELFYYVVGVASIALGYYFNYHYVQEYVIPSSNPIWGPGSWQEFIALGYTNPAASSASEDYTIMSLLIFPVFAIVDGRRRGIKHAWLYIGFILFASSAFAWAFYLATAERQRRHKLSDVEVASRA